MIGQSDGDANSFSFQNFVTFIYIRIFSTNASNISHCSMDRPGFIEVNEITDITSFLKSIDWHDTWLYLLGLFHVAITVLSFLSRNMANCQIVLFISLRELPAGR